MDLILVNVRCLNKKTTSLLKRVTAIQGSRTGYQSCSILLFMSCKCYHHLCLWKKHARISCPYKRAQVWNIYRMRLLSNHFITKHGRSWYLNTVYINYHNLKHGRIIPYLTLVDAVKQIRSNRQETAFMKI